MAAGMRFLLGFRSGHVERRPTVRNVAKRDWGKRFVSTINIDWAIVYSVGNSNASWLLLGQP